MVEHGVPDVTDQTLRGPTVPLDLGRVKVGIIAGVNPGDGILIAGVLSPQLYKITPDIVVIVPLCTRLEQAAG